MKGGTIWLTGLSGAGKSTIATNLNRRLLEGGTASFMLDGDELRTGLSSDLGLDPDDRRENIRRAAEVAKLLASAGVVSIVALISPYRQARQNAREIHEVAGLPFAEVFIDAPVEVCRQRDTKGLYAKSMQGMLTGLTGVDAEYEPPENADLVVETANEDSERSAGRVYDLVMALLKSAIPST